MIKNCANKDKSISLKNKAHTATLHNCHYEKGDIFIPLSKIKKDYYYNIVVYCGLVDSYDYYFCNHNINSLFGVVKNYKLLRAFLISQKILNRSKGWDLTRINRLHLISIINTEWIRNNFLEEVSK